MKKNFFFKQQSIQTWNYEKNKFINNRQIIIFSIRYPQFNLGLCFSWIIRFRCGFKCNTVIAIRSGRVIDDCPRYCPYCGLGKQSFEHWIFKTAPPFLLLDVILWILSLIYIHCFQGSLGILNPDTSSRSFCRFWKIYHSFFIYVPSWWNFSFKWATIQ